MDQVANQETGSVIVKSENSTSKFSAEKLISTSDVLISCSLPILFFLSWFTPAHTWRRTCQSLGPLILPTLARDKQSLLQQIRSRIGQWELSKSPDQVLGDYLAGHIERKLQTLRLYRPGSWEPSIKLEGKEHIDSALDRGKGAILWDANFAFAHLVTKIAAFQAGYRVSHLSQPSHGFDSSTRYGMQVLNPLIYSIEKRYIDERVLLAIDSSTQAMQRLIQCLNGNGVVSIVASDNAKKPVTVSFLNGTAGFAVGGPYLASKTGAALLPVFTLRDDSGGFLVTVERKITIARSGSSRDSIEFAVNEYADRLTPYVEHNPGEWLGWPNS